MLNNQKNKSDNFEFQVHIIYLQQIRFDITLNLQTKTVHMKCLIMHNFSWKTLGFYFSL